VYLQMLQLHIKICLGEQQSPLFISVLPHISETNRARKLKFNVLFGIYRYYDFTGIIVTIYRYLQVFTGTTGIILFR